MNPVLIIGEFCDITVTDVVFDIAPKHVGGICAVDTARVDGGAVVTTGVLVVGDLIIVAAASVVGWLIAAAASVV